MTRTSNSKKIVGILAVLSIFFVNCEMSPMGGGYYEEEEDPECYEVFGHCEKSETRFEKGSYFTTWRIFPGCDWICINNLNLRIEAQSGQILGAYLWATNENAAPGYQNIECYMPGSYSSVLTGTCNVRGSKVQFVQIQHTTSSMPRVSGRYTFCGW